MNSMQQSVPLQRLISVLLLLMLSTSCTPLLSLRRGLIDVDLSIRVTPTDSPGTYAIAGDANLPNQTEITVVAVRYLRPAEPTAAISNPQPTYSILAYQSVPVVGGKWQTQLGLWQVAPNGKFQEAWQLDQARLGLSVQPDSDVVFLSTLVPVDRLTSLEQQLERQGRRLTSKFVHNTPEGQRYAQAQQALAIALPTGETTPISPRAEELNDGWGKRFLLLPEPPNTITLEFPEQRQTNAPFRSEELLH